MTSEAKKYHHVLAEYFHTQNYFLESIEDQRKRAKHLPPSPRPVNTRKVVELPFQRIQSQNWDEVEKLFTNLHFLESKTESGKVFELAKEFSSAIKNISSDRPKLRILLLLNEALHRDLHFIARHTNHYPQVLFQCFWNSCWWYDCEVVEVHYRSIEEQINAPWQSNGPKLHELIEFWRKSKEETFPELVWLRSIRPPLMHLGSSLKDTFDLPGIEKVSFCLSSDGSYLIAHNEKILRIWNVKTSQEIYNQLLLSSLYSVSLSPDGKYLACAHTDYIIRVYEVQTGNQSLSLIGHTDEIKSICFSPDGKKICTGSKDCFILIWNALNGELITRFNGHKASVRKVVFSGDGDRIISTSDDWTVRIVDALQGIELSSLAISPPTVPYYDKILDVGISGGGNHVGVLRLEGINFKKEYNHYDPVYFIEILDIISGEIIRHKCGTKLPRSFALFGDGSKFAIGDADWTINLFDTKSGKSIRSLRVHSGEVVGVTFAPDGRYLFTQGATPDTSIKIWDLEFEGSPLYLPSPWYGCMGIAFSADSTLIAFDHGFEGVIFYDSVTGVIMDNNDKFLLYSSIDTLELDRWPLAYRHGYSDYKRNIPETIPFLPSHAVAINNLSDQETAISTVIGLAWFPIRLEYPTPNPLGTKWAGAFDNYLCLLEIENNKESAIIQDLPC